MTNIQNKLMEIWDTPFGIPPFEDILPEHFIPAIEKAITNARLEINKIVEDENDPTFENTVEALENSGKLLNLISSTLFNLNSAETNNDIQAATQKASQLLTKFSNDITLNRVLFSKIKTVYSSELRKNIKDEQYVLLNDKFRSFRNGGAELEGESRKRFREVSEDLSLLTVQFDENLLAETNSFELHLLERSELAGLPDSIIDAAAQEARSRGKDAWIFTLHYPSYVPFMQYSEHRLLRKKMFLAYSSRCFKENNKSNILLLKKIVNLRLELAKILGYSTYAEYILEDRMAASVDNVNTFLDKLLHASKPFARDDFNTIKKYASDLGHKGELEKWDWAFYAEKLKKKLYSFDDEILKPFFKLDNVEKAIFELAGTLYGLNFNRSNNTPSYHPDTKTYKVSDELGKHIAILIVDYHPRRGKSAGAWMTAYREQHRINKRDIRPIVSIVMNFSKPTKNKPALLTHNELTTLLHEFGHALHGMLSKCEYESCSGTNVKRDFVELPSQIMENWAYEKIWLDSWARHYETGEKISEELMGKIRTSLLYNEAYACNRQLGFGILDMAWHSISEPFEEEVDTFEKRALVNTELFNPVPGTNQSCAFGHLFSGGYAAGYYGYKWAEVLDADAFSVFQDKGIFDRKTASAFRINILEKGGSKDPKELYKNFRGSEPTIDAFMKRSGFIKT